MLEIRHDRLSNPAIIQGGKITRLSHDFETFCEISIKGLGPDAYSQHPSCEVLMCAYAIDTNLAEGEIGQWVPAEGELMPTALEDALLDERVVKTCWNKDFEWAIWKNVVGIEIPHYQWRDTQALSYALALPGALDKCGDVIGLTNEQKKGAAGTRLINLFSTPHTPSKKKPWLRAHFWHEPEKWQEFKEYNRQDVRAERAILRKLLRFDMPAHEWELWCLDQIINERGIPFNMDAVRAAIRLYEHLITERMERLRDLTGLANPNSNPQLLPWLRERGYPFEDLKKGHVGRALETAPPGTIRDVLTLRQDVSRSSPKKYYAIQRCVDHVDGVLRNTLQFAGAGRTWRWAGRIFQPQNLPRPDREYKKIMARVVEHLETLDPESIDLVYANPMTLLVSCIRSVAQAPDGYLFFDADLNAIENRLLGWITRCPKILKVFEDGRDPYIDFATYMYRQQYAVLWEEYKAGDDHRRQISKPAVLAAGYGLGPGEERISEKTGEIEGTGLIGYARNMNIVLTHAEAEHAVATFRATYEEVVEFWWAIERAAKRCIHTGQNTTIEMIGFDLKAPFLRMTLPSGRALHYCRPRIEAKPTPWGEIRDQITYEGLNDVNQWVRTTTRGAKLLENADQAIARDVLANGMMLAHQRDLDVRLHVHDQIIGLAPYAVAERHLEILQECMSVTPEWGTFRGMTLPLASAGHVSKVFLKD